MTHGQSNGNGAVPDSEARTSHAPASIAEDSEVAPPLQPATWNVTTGGPSSHVELELAHMGDPLPLSNLNMLTRYEKSIHQTHQQIAGSGP